MFKNPHGHIKVALKKNLGDVKNSYSIVRQIKGKTLDHKIVNIKLFPDHIVKIVCFEKKLLIQLIVKNGFTVQDDLEVGAVDAVTADKIISYFKSLARQCRTFTKCFTLEDLEAYLSGNPIDLMIENRRELIRLREFLLEMVPGWEEKYHQKFQPKKEKDQEKKILTLTA